MPGLPLKLKEIFGYDTFRPHQREIAEAFLAGRDALAVLPTGAGKSLCYQLPAVVRDGLTVVISPLIALMKDQVDQLTASGVAATFLNSSLDSAEARRRHAGLHRGEYRLLYLAPERLMLADFLPKLGAWGLTALAVDEAHCISEWGHDFRPEYRRLREVRETFADIPLLALTATATPRVREDILAQLELRNPAVFVASFNRPNLNYRVVPKAKAAEQVVKFVAGRPDEAGIVYCQSRRAAEAMALALSKDGVAAVPYHAGLEQDERARNQDAFLRDEARVVCATIAFGMGINKPNVRFVVHYDLPGSIDNYYQEIGRAGRDGLPAHCLLLFGYGDIQKVQFFIGQKTEAEQRVANILLSQLMGFAETDICRRVPLLNYFGETGVPEHCGMCDNCGKGEEEKTLVDLTIPAQMFLSCVKRTGEIFGAGHIIDVLRGSNSQKVLKFGHEELSTYGIGKAYSARQWRHIARQLIQKRQLFYNYEHGSLKLTPKAWDVLRGKETFCGRVEEAKKERGAILRQRAGEVEDYDTGLFEILRKKRKELADQANLPPFTIFHDRTLREMASCYPRSRENLLAIYGIGKSKLEKYADAFLDIIGEYCQTHQMPEQQKRGIFHRRNPDE